MIDSFLKHTTLELYCKVSITMAAIVDKGTLAVSCMNYIHEVNVLYSRHNGMCTSPHIQRVAKYLGMVSMHTHRLDCIIVLQSPYKEDLCSTHFGSALAHCRGTEYPPVSVSRIVDYIMEHSAKSVRSTSIVKNMSMAKATALLRRSLLLSLKHSYMMCIDGIILINAECYNTTDALERQRQRILTQQLMRGMVKSTCCDSPCTIKVCSLGEVARSTVNSVLASMRSLHTVSLRHTAGANPASRGDFVLSSIVCSVLTGYANKLTMGGKTSDEAIEDLNRKISSDSMEITALKSQLSKMTKVSGLIIESLVLHEESKKPTSLMVQASEILDMVKNEIKIINQSNGIIKSSSASHTSGGAPAPKPSPVVAKDIGSPAATPSRKPTKGLKPPTSAGKASTPAKKSVAATEEVVDDAPPPDDPAETPAKTPAKAPGKKVKRVSANSIGSGMALTPPPLSRRNREE